MYWISYGIAPWFSSFAHLIIFRAIGGPLHVIKDNRPLK